MNIIKSALINLVLTGLFSSLFILLIMGILDDMIHENFWQYPLSFTILNFVISGFIHLFIFIPGILVFQPINRQLSVQEIYKLTYPGLLLPLILFSFLSGLILFRGDINQNLIISVFFVGMSLMFIHSLSLYFFLQNFMPSKINTNEKINQINL